MHQSVVEVGTNICMNVDEAEKKLNSCERKLLN
jgi:hypothetical protein